MYRKIKIFILLFLLTASITAQTELSGKIIDLQKEPLTGVNVLLLNYSDSSYINGTSSDPEGIFSIKNVSTGNYILSFSMMGYKKQNISIQVNNNLPVNINDIILEEDTYLLSTVTIDGKQNPMKFEAGKTTINLASSVFGSQGSVFDALKNLPGVFIKEDGTIIMDGQSGANVLINGKMTYLSDENLVNLLKSMPASSVDKIELITTPPAQYDASGKAGLINIKLMKNLYMGTSGLLDANLKYGEKLRGYLVGRFAFQNEKFSFSAVYYRNQGNSTNKLTIHREHFLESGRNNEPVSMEQNNYTEYNYADNYFRINADYDISKNISMNCYFYSTLNNMLMPGDNRTKFGQSGLKTDSILHTSIKNDINQKTFAGGIFSEYKDNSKKEANVSADFLFYDNRTSISMGSQIEQSVNNKWLDTDSLTGYLPGKIGMFAAQGNFSILLKERSILKTGLKSSYVQIDNETDYRNKKDNGWQVDLSSKNRNKYNENINAVYLQWEAKITNWSLNVGVRLENTRINASFLQDDPAKKDSTYSQNYTNLFPNVMLQYNFPDDKNILSLMYNKRITRPNYRNLLPYHQIFDKYTITSGNPNLKAEITDQFEFTYIYRRTYRAALILINTKSAIAQNFRTEGSVAYVFPDNISSQLRYGLKLDAQNFIPLKWWQQSINFVVFRSKSDWIEIGEQKSNRVISCMFNTNHQFMLGKGWSAWINGAYNAKMTVAQTTILPFGMLDIGIQKKIFKDNASIRIFVEDIFHTNHEDASIDFSFLKARTTSINDSRAIGIAFSYNFKKGEQKRNISQERSMDESKRVNL